MKIKNLIREVLTEEIKNKKLFDFLNTKWSSQKPNISKEEINNLYDAFSRVQDSLSLNRPQVISFLTRFDGNHGFEKFDPTFIKDITKYSYTQIESLIDEYTDRELGNNDADVFATKDTRPTEEKIEKSKDLWYGNNNLIFENDGLRVYDIKDQLMSIKYGYFYHTIYKKQLPNARSPWCVTWRPDYGGTNMWGRYRNERSFYFIIDDSKSPETDKFYMSTLQRDTSRIDNIYDYKLTSLLNDGDYSKNWDQIVEIYPQLIGQKELFAVKPFSEDELNEKNIVGLINETSGSQYNFIRVDRDLKKAYINNNGLLTRPESWKSMDDKLRNLYIQTTNIDNAITKFNNYAFLMEVKKVGNEFTQLNNKLKVLGFKTGTGIILDELMKNEFNVWRISDDNEQIKIYQSKVSGNFGIYSNITAGFLKDYEPNFKKSANTLLKIKDPLKIFFVETFSNGITEFKSLFNTKDSNKKFGHFISKEKWEELENEVNQINKGSSEKQTFSPETDVDIKEMKRGY